MADDTENNDTAQPFAFSPQMQSYADAIKAIESSGGDYGVLGPKTKSGDRAHGAYQVMGANIPQWTQESLGASMDPKEFLADASAQDKVFNYKFGQYLQKYGNPQDAASAWFTGRPLSQGAGSSDVLGTTGQDYVNKFNNLLNGTPTAPPQHFQAMAPGALSASSLTGNDGALWNMVNQQQEPTWHDRIGNIASILASMGGNSSLASTLQSTNKTTAQSSQADKLVKFLQLKKLVQAANSTGVTFQGTLTDGTPYYTNQQGAVSDAQGNALPNDFMTQHSEKDNSPKMNNQVIAGQSKNVSQISNNASLLNEINAARDELVNNPETAKDLNGLSSYKGNLANFLGESNVQSEFQKRVQRILNTYVYNASSQLGGRQTDKLRELEKNMIAPNGAMNDPNTLLGVLNDAADKTKNNYLANAAALKSYNTNYGEKAFPFIDPVSSAPGKLDDYLTNNNSKWDAANAKITAGVPAFKQAHDIRTGKVTPPSRVDAISNWISDNK